MRQGFGIAGVASDLSCTGQVSINTSHLPQNKTSLKNTRLQSQQGSRQNLPLQNLPSIMTSRPLPPRMSKEKHAERRKGLMEYRREVTEGFDLVAMALENPKQLSEQQRLALLGRAPYTYDQMVLVQKVTNNRFGSAASLVSAAYNWYCNLNSPADCKLMLCDVRHLDDPSQLDAEYAAQLRAEAEQTPEERAREAVRTLSEKRARRNARLLLPELEKLTAEELHELAEKRSGATIWRRVEPALPEWINHIMKHLFNYGFAYYRSKEVSDRFGDKFKAVWKRLERQASSVHPYDRQETIAYRAGVNSIYQSGCLQSAINDVEWSEYQATEDYLSSIRRYVPGRNPPRC